MAGVSRGSEADRECTQMGEVRTEHVLSGRGDGQKREKGTMIK